MASDIETWWPANYPAYTIRDLHALPIFRRFLQLHYPYERANTDKQESFTTNDLADEFKTSTADLDESFSHNKQQGKYTYMRKYREKDCEVCVVSSVQGNSEWGSVQRRFEAWELQEAWKLTPPNREYEKFTLEKGSKKGFRCAVLPKDVGTERWTEEIWEAEGEETFKKTWEKEGESGGEMRTRKGDYTWGEDWVTAGNRTEKKVWHEKGPKKWGESSGQQDTKAWHSRWETDPDSKLEEKVTQEGSKTTGVRYTAKGAEWYRQEWEGAQAFPEGQVPLALSSPLLARLEEFYLRTESAVQQSSRTLHVMLSSQPAFDTKVQALEERLALLQASDRSSPELLFTRVEELRMLGNDQESLKQAMWETGTGEWRLFEHFANSLKTQADDSYVTLRKLAQVIQMDSFETKLLAAQTAITSTFSSKTLSFPDQLQAWKALFASLEALKREHFQYATQLVPEKDASLLMERALRRQDLEDSVKHAYIVLTRTHDFVSDLAALAQDEKGAAAVAVLRKKYEEIYTKFVKKPGSDQAQELMEVLKSYNALQVTLLGRIRGDGMEAQLRELTAATDIAAEIVPVCLETLRKLQTIPSLSSESSEIAAISRSLAETSSSGESSPDSQVAVMQALQRWCDLLSRSIDRLRDSSEGGLDAIKMLDPVAADLTQLVQETALSDADVLSRFSTLQQESKACFHELSLSPTEGLAKRIARLLRSLSLLLRSVGVKQSGGSPFVVLEAVISDLHSEALEEVRGDTEAEEQLFTLRTDLDSHYSDLLQTPTRPNFARLLADIKAYRPLLRSAVLKTIEGFLPSLDRSIAMRSAESEAQVAAIREKVAGALEGYKTDSRPWHIAAVREALSDYQLLLDAMKSADTAELLSPKGGKPPSAKPGAKRPAKK